MLFMALSRYSAISNVAGLGITVKRTKHLIMGNFSESLPFAPVFLFLVSMIIGICMAIPESIKFGMYDLHAMNPTRFPDHYTICTNKMNENEIKALSIGIFVVKVARSCAFVRVVIIR